MISVVGVLTAVGGWVLIAGLWGTQAPSEGSNFVSQAAEELHTPRHDVAEDAEEEMWTPVAPISAGATSGQDASPVADDAEEEVKAAEEEVVFTQAPEGYFDDALFIGDSRTQGLELYGGIDEATYYTSQGLMVNTALVKTIVTLNGQQLSIPDALDKVKFGKVYIMLGINELGWKSQDRFIEYYGQLIDTVREKQPDAIIYVQSLLPVSKAKSDSSDVFNNTRVALFNSCIKQVIEDRDVVWLDVGAALQDENGCMPEGSTFDGIHLNQKYCKKWAEFLRSNVVAES